MMRGTLLHVLHKGLADNYSLEVMFGRHLLGILSASLLLLSLSLSSEGIMCKFNGRLMADPYNLVIGCNGIQLAVIQYWNNCKIRPTTSS